MHYKRHGNSKNSTYPGYVYRYIFDLHINDLNFLTLCNKKQKTIDTRVKDINNLKRIYLYKF